MPESKLLLGKALFVLMIFALSISANASNVIVETPLGNIEIELFDDIAPGTVENFLNYVDDGDYEGTFVHRSVPGFVIQGGGFTFEDGAVPPIPTDPPIENEFQLSNIRGTIAMAKRGGDPDSATSQWFINLADNSGNLDGDDGQGGGFFTVFGQVIGNGMAVADAIAALPRINAGGAFTQLPVIDFSTQFLQAENFVYSNVVRVISGFEINPGVSGAWFNAETSGQGWLLDVIVKEAGLDLFVAWFTYDTNPPPSDENDGFASRQHRWFTALGGVSGDTAELDIFLSSGGVFNDPRATATESVGSLTIQFSNCTNAQLAFDFDDSDENDGMVDVTRLSPDVFCQTIVDGIQATE